MHELPILVGHDIVLRKIKPSDIDDRLQIGRHHESIHMCGGETLGKPDYPDRKYWADWYESHKLDYEYRESSQEGSRLGASV